MRPARPRRWSALARLTRTVSSSSEADIGLIDRNAHEAAVDDDAHALDGQRGLGDRRGEHDLAPARRRGGDGEILRAAVERAVEWRNVDVSTLDARFQALGDAPDFALPRQEDEDRAAFACERLERDARDLVLDSRPWVATDISCHDREGAALALNQWRIAEKGADARAVERRRHDKKPQILTQTLLRVEGEGEAEIGVERAFVEFVKQNGRHALERRVVEDHARKHTLGHDLDACTFRNEARETHAQADSLANLFPKRRGHAGGCGASGKTTRLKQDEALALRPRLVEERQRRARGLAGARRRDEHSAGMRCERRPQRRQHVVDGKRSGERRQLRVLDEALGG